MLEPIENQRKRKFCVGTKWKHKENIVLRVNLWKTNWKHICCVGNYQKKRKTQALTWRRDASLRLAIGWSKTFDVVITLVNNYCLFLSDLHRAILEVSRHQPWRRAAVTWRRDVTPWRDVTSWRCDVLFRWTLSKTNVKPTFFQWARSKTNVKPPLFRWALSKTNVKPTFFVGH